MNSDWARMLVAVVVVVVGRGSRWHWAALAGMSGMCLDPRDSKGIWINA